MRWVLPGMLAAVLICESASADVKKGEFLVARRGVLACLSVTIRHRS